LRDAKRTHSSSIGAFHLMTQINTTSFYLSWHSRSNKNRTILVPTCVIKWKALNSLFQVPLPNILFILLLSIFWRERDAAFTRFTFWQLWYCGVRCQQIRSVGCKNALASLIWHCYFSSSFYGIASFHGTSLEDQWGQYLVDRQMTEYLVKI